MWRMIAAPTHADKPQPAPTTFSVFNPSSGEKIRELPNHDKEHVLAEMARVRSAAPRWAETPIAERCKKLQRVSAVIARRMDEIAQIVSQENGKVRVEALVHDVGPTLLTMNYFCENAPRILADEPVNLAVARHRKSYIAYRPK